MIERLPQPESGDLGRYLEDTITIDWQTPSVTATGRRLVEGVETPEARVEWIFRFVRDEISDSFDIETDVRTCRASEVLRERTGVSHAQSHLLAALLRFAGFPTGFCYARLRDSERPDRFVLHGFNAVHWAPIGASRTGETRTGRIATPEPPTGGWIYPLVAVDRSTPIDGHGGDGASASFRSG
jgi:transglutaminase-like putative cysteine protease